MLDFKYEMGQTVKSIVTGYKGVIMARAEYFNGCLKYQILQKKLGSPSQGN